MTELSYNKENSFIFFYTMQMECFLYIGTDVYARKEKKEYIRAYIDIYVREIQSTMTSYADPAH